MLKKIKIESCKDHPEGCCIRFRKLKEKEMVHHSEPRQDVVIDYDKNNKIIGIEFYLGMKEIENHFLKNSQKVKV